MEQYNNIIPINTDLLKNYAESLDDIVFLLNTFMAQSKESLAILQKSTSNLKYKEWSEAAHKLKGGCSLVGAEHLYALSAKAQCMEKNRQQEREEVLRNIEKEYYIIEEYLDKNFNNN